MDKFKLDNKLKIKPDDPIFHLHEYDVDTGSNHIYLMGTELYVAGAGEAIDEPGIDYTIANRFVRNLNLCMRMNPNKPILIHMKTNGGYWEEGMAIYDAIKACPVPVTILNYTHARSMSSLIFQAANKRVMMPNSNFMYHDGTIQFYGTIKQARSSMETVDVAEKTMMNIYVNSMKNSPQSKVKNWSEDKIHRYLRAKMDKKEDVYLSAEEAVSLGLADEVFGPDKYDWSKLVEYTEEQLER